MVKNWKNLFVKTDEKENKKESVSESYSFPVNDSSSPQKSNVTAPPIADPTVVEVLKVYEDGLDSINMPGYDFYEFYKTVASTGNPNEQTYLMAYSMAKTLDKTITPSKLLTDAEFYISKINEVHSQYVTQGQQKLNSIQEKKASEKNQLQAEIDNGSRRINELRAELQSLESEINQKKNILVKVDDSYYPQEKSIREKLSANDMARNTSIDKLNSIKEGIKRIIK